MASILLLGPKSHAWGLAFAKNASLGLNKCSGNDVDMCSLFRFKTWSLSGFHSSCGPLESCLGSCSNEWGSCCQPDAAMIVGSCSWQIRSSTIAPRRCGLFSNNEWESCCLLPTRCCNDSGVLQLANSIVYDCTD